MRTTTPLLSLVAASLVLTPFVATQAQNEQFIPALVYRTGPYAAGGSGFWGGMEDYMELLNIRDGGLGGVTLTWEECETAYNSDRGVECYERLKGNGPTGASVVHPLSDRHHVPAHRARHRRQESPLISMGYGRTDATNGKVLPVRLPAGDQLLEPEHGEDQVHRDEGRRHGQSEGQEDCQPLS